MHVKDGTLAFEIIAAPPKKPRTRKAKVTAGSDDPEAIEDQDYDDGDVTDDEDDDETPAAE